MDRAAERVEVVMMTIAAVAGLPIIAFASLGVHKLHAIMSVDMYLRR